MNYSHSFSLAALLGTVCAVLLAQESESSRTVRDRAALVRAKKIIQKLDKDGSGTFEKHENSAAWKRYRKLDADRDGVLTVDELRKLSKTGMGLIGERKLEIAYKSSSKGRLVLDLYYPPKTARRSDNGLLPIVVYTHGGGWAAGSKQNVAKGAFKILFDKLLAEGFAVASVNYRLCRPDGSVTMRDCVIDSKDAVRYLAKNSETLKLDCRRFFVMGDSAGGHLAQMLLLSSPTTLVGDEGLASTTYRVVAGVSWYGPCDFENMDLFNHDNRADFRDRFSRRILGVAYGSADKRVRYREVSPVNYLTKDSAPLLMVQGDKDTTIPVKHAYHMKQRADAVNAPVEIMIIRNSGHNWRKVEADIAPSREKIIERTVKFFVDQLGSSRRMTKSEE